MPEPNLKPSSFVAAAKNPDGRRPIHPAWYIILWHDERVACDCVVPLLALNSFLFCLGGEYERLVVPGCIIHVLDPRRLPSV